MPIQIVKDFLFRWFGLFAPPCGVCEEPLDRYYGKIWLRAYHPTKDPEFICMKVCSNCLDKLEMEGNHFVKAVEDWKSEFEEDTL